MGTGFGCLEWYRTDGGDGQQNGAHRRSEFGHRLWFGGWRDTPVYWRDHLPLEVHLSGPAIVEQMDTTIVVDPGCTVTSDRDGNLMVEVGDD